MSSLNRIHNCHNPYQGNFKRVLCVCSAGLLRSPTAAVVLSQAPYNFNTRAAGLEQSYALVPVDDVLLIWAEEVVCMTASQGDQIRDRLTLLKCATPVKVLNIQDDYEYRDPALIELIRKNYV